MAGRLQVNLLINPNPKVGLYNKVRKHFMPILWFEQRVTISPIMATGIRIATSFTWIGQTCSAIVLIIGLIMVVWLSLNHFLHRRITGQEPNGDKTAVIKAEEQKNLEDSPLLMQKDEHVNNCEIQNSCKV